MSFTPASSDFLIYFFAAVLLAFAGMGVLRALRARVDPSVAWLLAPAVAAEVWAVALGLGVTEHIRVRTLALPIWMGTIAAAIYGYRSRRWSRSAGMLVVASIGLPMLALLPYFMFGLANYPGSRLPDGWSYVAYGQYLWSYPRGTEGGLQPLYQWASHLSGTRHVASAQLGLLSVLMDPGTIASSTGLSLALSLFVFGSACGAFARARDWSLPRSALVMTLAVLSGWTMNIVFANNFDNLAALAAFPALATVATLLRSHALSLWVLFGIVLAGLVYTYPELATVVAPVAIVMVLERWWRHKEIQSWRGVASAAAAFVLLVLPYAPSVVQYVLNQAQFGLQTNPRPGEGLFSGLLAGPYQMSAFWSLGGEFRANHYHTIQTVAAGGLFLVLATALVRIVRARELGLLAALVAPLVIAPFIVVKAAYSYGAYKMIAIGWWALAFAVVIGVGEFNRRSLRGVAAWAAALAISASIPSVALARALRQVVHPPASGIDRYRSVRDASVLTAGSPVGVFVDDWEASEWAVYFLRDSSTRLGDVDAYLAMPHVQALLTRAPSYSWQEMRFLLTDATYRNPISEAEKWNLVWQNSAYRLWDTGVADWAIVTNINVPNGLERLNGKPFFWLGGGPTKLIVTARETGCVRFTTIMVPGPSVRRTASRRVTLKSTAGQDEELTLQPGPARLGWLVRSGVNELTLVPDDEPDAPPEGTDTRPLIAGLSEIAVASASATGISPSKSCR